MLCPSSFSSLSSDLLDAPPELAALRPESPEAPERGVVCDCLGRLLDAAEEGDADMGEEGLEIDPNFLDRAEALKWPHLGQTYCASSHMLSFTRPLWLKHFSQISAYRFADTLVGDSSSPSSASATLSYHCLRIGWIGWGVPVSWLCKDGDIAVCVGLRAFDKAMLVPGR